MRGLVVEDDGDLRRAVHNVMARDDVPVRRDDHAAAAAGLGLPAAAAAEEVVDAAAVAAARVLHVDADDRRRGDLHHLRARQPGGRAALRQQRGRARVRVPALPAALVRGGGRRRGRELRALRLLLLLARAAEEAAERAAQQRRDQHAGDERRHAHAPAVPVRLLRALRLLRRLLAVLLIALILFIPVVVFHRPQLLCRGLLLCSIVAENFERTSERAWPVCVRLWLDCGGRAPRRRCRMLPAAFSRFREILMPKCGPPA